MVAAPEPSSRRDAILAAAIAVFGRSGYKKTSVDDLAQAANLSKQGLYLHFSGKDELFQAAMRKYLDDALAQVQAELRRDAPLFKRLMAAMDAWFGRHLATFQPVSFDVIEAGDRIEGLRVERYKTAFQAELARALADAPEFVRAGNVCTPKEVAQVLFQCGLTWKEGRASRAEFIKKMAVCVRACCQLRD